MSFLLIIGFIFLVFALVTGLSGAPWVPARRRDIAPLLTELQLKPGAIVFELGCGDGRLVKALAQRGYSVTGYEINPLLWLVAKIRCRGDKNARVLFVDLWKADLSRVDAVVAFLVPRTMPKLGDKAKNEMKRGSILASYVFEIENQKAYKAVKPWWFYKY